jgi:hypothetical protein
MGLKLNSSSGSITLEAQNTAGDTTVTIPSSTGTVLMTDGDGSNLSGIQSPLVAGTDYLAPTGDGSGLTGIDTGANAALSNLSGVTGTSGQIMTSDGSGNATMQDAAGGGSWNLLQTQTISSSVSSVGFTSNIDNTYDSYLIKCSGLKASAGEDVDIYLSSDAGSTWKTSAYAYSFSKIQDNGSSNEGQNGFGKINLYYMDASSTSSFELKWDAPSSTTALGILSWHSAFESYGKAKSTIGSGFYDSEATALNAIKIVARAGTFSEGVLSLYGISQ